MILSNIAINATASLYKTRQYGSSDQWNDNHRRRKCLSELQNNIVVQYTRGNLEFITHTRILRESLRFQCRGIKWLFRRRSSSYICYKNRYRLIPTIELSHIHPTHDFPLSNIEIHENIMYRKYDILEEYTLRENISIANLSSEYYMR